MLNNIMSTISSIVMLVLGISFIAIIAVGSKFAYDVYSEVNHSSTPVGQIKSQVTGAAEELGFIKKTPYQKAVTHAADWVNKNI